MKTLFTLLLSVTSTISIFGQRDPNQNPYWLIEDLNTKKVAYKSSGQISIGMASNETMFLGPKPVNHVKKTISVTIPAGATILKIHPFILNIDGLKEPGGSPSTTPWGTTPNIDYRWGTFHSPQKNVLSSGETVVSVEYDNWSDIETRAGFLVVEYSGGTATPVKSPPTVVGSNATNKSVRFYNPTGTSRTVYLYVAELDFSSNGFEFCSVARYLGEIKPGGEAYATVGSDKILYWGSYTVNDCKFGNNYAAEGSTTGTSCPTICEISINNQ